MSYYSQEELAQFGFKYLGCAVRLSKKASIYNASNISIGDNSRVDDFCVLSAGKGGVVIGRNVHIAVFSSLIGSGCIEVQDFANISSRVGVYSSNDDYSGEYMSNPTVPSGYTNIVQAPVLIGRHVIIGAGSIILPGITLNKGVGVGALSLVNKDCEAFYMYAGTPARKIGRRSKKLLELEKSLNDEQGRSIEHS